MLSEHIAKLIKAYGFQEFDPAKLQTQGINKIHKTYKNEQTKLSQKTKEELLKEVESMVKYAKGSQTAYDNVKVDTEIEDPSKVEKAAEVIGSRLSNLEKYSKGYEGVSEKDL